MQQRNGWMAVILLIIASLPLAACIPAPAKANKIAPARVEKMEGTDLSRLILLPEAAQRLSIQSAPVHEQQVTHTWKVGGEVMALPTTSTPQNQVLVRVSLSESDAKMVRHAEPALVLPLASDGNAPSLKARPVQTPDVKALPVKAPAVGETEEAPGTLYYAVDSPGHGLVPGQRVFVELTLVNSGAKRRIIPYAAVLYDSKGDTWVYTSPETLVFIRHRVSIDYIEGDRAVLFAGPPVDMPVVTVGAAELYGAEFGVGK